MPSKLVMTDALSRRMTTAGLRNLQISLAKDIFAMLRKKNSVTDLVHVGAHSPNENIAPARSAVYNIAGRCLLESGDEFACEAYEVTARQIEIGCRKSARQGSVVIAYLDNVGIVRGLAGRTTPRGFMVSIEVTDERRARIATRLDWHAARAAETAEQRAAARIVPVRRLVEIRLSDDLLFQGTILNLSMTGAAIAAEPRCRAYVGSVVKVGKRYAIVVRHLEGGFAVQFKLPFIRETFNENIIL